MYRELIGEIAKSGLTKKQLAKEIGVTEKTLSNKLTGKTDFTWSEVLRIRSVIDPMASLTLEHLFKTEDLKNLN